MKNMKVQVSRWNCMKWWNKMNDDVVHQIKPLIHPQMMHKYANLWTQHYHKLEYDYLAIKNGGKALCKYPFIDNAYMCSVGGGYILQSFEI